jgi:hypothetical protein
MKRTLFVLVSLTLYAAVAHAQTFSSGSTGADGALVINANTTVQIPESGVFNFTTVTVIPGVTLTFASNQRNTPVMILAQGDISIGGTVRVSAFCTQTCVDSDFRIPGPGGFFGGAIGQAGFGPAGGQTGNPGEHGQWVGALTLVPIVGGSGGGGNTSFVASGGGGGGAIVIASSASINVSGAVLADGSSGGNFFGARAGSGSGGAIRLVANAVQVSGVLAARGGAGNAGNDGLVRLEAPIGSLTFTGTSTPAAVLSPINPSIIPTPSTAALTISSIGGFPVFSDAGVRPGSVDVVLPRGLSDPISVVVQGRNIPLGTQVNLNLSGSTSTTYTPGTLAGSFELSSATLQVNGLDRNAETHLFVFVTFDVPQNIAALNPAGPDQVAKLRIQASPGKPSTLAFLRRDGSVIDLKKIPTALLRHFGYQKH